MSDSRNLLGEWLFSVAAFGSNDDARAYLDGQDGIKSYLDTVGLSFDDVIELRDERLPEWVQSVVREINWGCYDLVGFTSTFAQQCATLAISREIRELYQNVPLVYGGANFDGEMGLEFQRILPWLDYIVIGEGDQALPGLVHALADGDKHRGVPGVHRRLEKDDHMVPTEAPRIKNLDILPVPEYEEYYSTLARLGRQKVCGGASSYLLMETARGCWWGEKHHCTFCGLKQSSMAYRSKSPERALSEIMYLSSRYRTLQIMMVDDILDANYSSSLAGLLARNQHDLELFYEIKANTKPSDVLALRIAGVKTVQPGIESLSSHVLSLMRKGTNMLLNVRFLKWASTAGMKVVWNILTGFPGETDDDNERQAQIIPALYHLAPPMGCGRIWLERFSPNFEDARIGVIPSAPVSAYRHVYPIPTIDHSKIAYYFEYPENLGGSARSFQMLEDAVTQWRSRHSETACSPKLQVSNGPDFSILIDTRDGTPRRAVLEGWQSAAYQLGSDTAVSVRKAAEMLKKDGYGEIRLGKISDFYEKCVSERLTIGEDGRFLSLALPATYSLPRLAIRLGNDVG